MQSTIDHRWDLNPSKAVALQRELATEVRLQSHPGMPRWVAGADVSFNKHSPTIYAGFVILDSYSLKVVDRAGIQMDVRFPYVPGLLSFREIPALLAAWEKLATKPEVIVVDGQGIAHPRRLGIASHLGLVLNLPTIGCGKSRLVGTFEEPGSEAGCQSKLFDRGEQIGVVLRTKKNVKPLFVSPGHLMDFDDSVRILLSLRAGYRLPETTRQAHLYVNELRMDAKEQPIDTSIPFSKKLLWE